MPSIFPRTNNDEESSAAVFPALTTASASPSLTNLTD